MIPDEIPDAPGSVIGHNSGSIVEAAKAEQLAALIDTPRDDGRTFKDRRADFLRSAAAQVVRDRQSAADAGDTIKLAREVWDLIEADRKTRSDPFFEAHRAITAQAREFWQPVADAMVALKKQIDDWSAEEDQRIAAQQAEQDAEFARMRAAAAPPPPAAAAPEPAQAETGRAYLDYTAPAPSPPAPSAPVMQPARRAPIRGDLGAMISATTATTYEIEDFSKLPDHILQSPTVREAILTVVQKTAKHMGVPPGIKVVTAATNRVK